MLTHLAKTFEEIKTLTPAFDGVSGWLSGEEYDLIDPNQERFIIVNEVVFPDNSTFIKIVARIK